MIKKAIIAFAISFLIVNGIRSGAFTIKPDAPTQGALYSSDLAAAKDALDARYEKNAQYSLRRWRAE